MKTFLGRALIVAVLLLAGITQIGCKKWSIVEQKQAIIDTGGIRENIRNPILNGCIVITNIPKHGLWRVVVQSTNQPNRLHSGWSAKPIPIGSKASWTFLESQGFSEDHYHNTHVVTAD